MDMMTAPRPKRKVEVVAEENFIVDVVGIRSGGEVYVYVVKGCGVGKR
jgi:hypothetical protein